jgi:hypothetical protein
MSDPIDPTRRPTLDDETNGLDCFGTESITIVDTADDSAAAIEFEEVLPAVRVASLPPVPVARAEAPQPPQRYAMPVIRLSPPPAWYRSAHWPGTQVTAVAVVFLLVGLIGMWMNTLRTKPVASVAVAPTRAATPARSAPPVSPSAVPAPPARTAPQPAPAIMAAQPSRLAAAPTTSTGSTVLPNSTARSTPRTLSAEPADVPEAARPVAPAATAATPIERPIVAAPPEVVRAEPVIEAPAPAAREAVAAVVPTDRSSIERVLAQYRDAYDRLDAPSAAVIWPRVDTRALSRAFSTLAQQDVSFDRCDLNITGVKANAQCTGEIRYVRRVGDQEPRVRRMSWSFAFERVADRWQIAQVTAD